MTASSPIPAGTPVAATDWAGLARRARRRNRWRQGALVAFLTLVSLPVMVPYLWMLVISLTARAGIAETEAFWPVLAVVTATAGLCVAAQGLMPPGRRRRGALVLVLVAGAVALAAVLSNHLSLANYRFLTQRDIVEQVRGKATAGGQFPSVWVALRNSLLVAAASTVVKTLAATLAGYYLSRFAFPGRSGFLQALLVIEAFPVLILTIPLFITIWAIGLLNTLWGPILVLSVVDLPFFIFVMKGFFDAVPWDIEMAAMADGATRRQAFRLVVLPQVRGGMIAVGTFAFLRGWEDYVFVNALRTGNSYWVMSTYLYYVAQDIMGVDYGMVAAVAVIYVLPSLVLYLLLQKYLTQMSLGGVKG